MTGSTLTAMILSKRRQHPLQSREIPLVSISDTAGHLLDTKALAKLIAVAAATLDSDRATARACIERAAEILSATGEGHPVHAEVEIRGGLAPWQHRNVTAYVAAHIGSAIRVSDLARVARLSVGHFFRAFRESFGEPPFAYVRRQRIRLAQTVMLSSRASLSRIALDCGMCDQAHFTRVFRRVAGMNPGVWRRLAGTGGPNMHLERSADITARRPTPVPGASRQLRDAATCAAEMPSSASP